MTCQHGFSTGFTGLTGFCGLNQTDLLYPMRPRVASAGQPNRLPTPRGETRFLNPVNPVNPVCIFAMTLALSLGTALAGEDVVTASSFGWNPADATKCLQAAVDSGAK